MNHKTKTAELIRTTRLVQKHGIRRTATIQGLTICGITDRIRRLEKQLGFRIFAPYDYGRLTFQGKEYLKAVD